MLKWTASAQKLALNTPPPTRTLTMHTPRHSSEMKRRRRRATIADKENLVNYLQPCTSTPMVPRLQGGSLHSSPLSDILNVTPELPTRAAVGVGAAGGVEREAVLVSTPETPRSSMKQSRLPNRRHSHVGFTLPVIAPSYATTLPRFIEEEYSPGTTAMALPTGQQLALRGLLPDPFLCNARYFPTPEVKKELKPQLKHTATIVKPQKRKLEQEFVEAAQEELNATKKSRTSLAANSTKMGDQTLDKLIDAILDSARKNEKKKKPRKSFNLRRRTLLRNHAEVEHTLMLSPSYTAGDDPASDLSFLNVESATMATTTTTTTTTTKAMVEITTPPTTAKPLATLSTKQKSHTTPALPKSTSPPTPKPVTPLPGTPIPSAILRQLPTPKLTPVWLRSRKSLTDSFSLVTPPPAIVATQKLQKRLSLAARPSSSSLPKNVAQTSTKPTLTSPLKATLTTLQSSTARKRRQCDMPQEAAAITTRANAAKKFKVDAATRSYFEIGLALPSIYV